MSYFGVVDYSIVALLARRVWFRLALLRSLVEPVNINLIALACATELLVRQVVKSRFIHLASTLHESTMLSTIVYSILQIDHNPCRDCRIVCHS